MDILGIFKLKLLYNHHFCYTLYQKLNMSIKTSCFYLTSIYDVYYNEFVLLI